MEIIHFLKFQSQYKANQDVDDQLYYGSIMKRWFGLVYLFNGISIPYGLFNADI